MSRRNTIILTPDPKGTFQEGIIKTGETPRPGTILQIDPSVALVGGRHTWKIYNRDADGNRPVGPFAVLREDIYQGRDFNTAYAAGDRAFLYTPVAGDELNLLYMNVSGTGDDVAVGDLLIVDDGTGKVLVTTGSPETEVAVALEALTDPTEDVLLWCKWTGF